MKSEVFALAKELEIIESIQVAPPTDGLFADSRSDEDQIGATYNELEWAMKFIANPHNFETLNERQKLVLDIYTTRNKVNQHKMTPIPVCIIPDELK